MIIAPKFTCRNGLGYGDNPSSRDDTLLHVTHTLYTLGAHAHYILHPVWCVCGMLIVRQSLSFGYSLTIQPKSKFM